MAWWILGTLCLLLFILLLSPASLSVQANREGASAKARYLFLARTFTFDDLELLLQKKDDEPADGPPQEEEEVETAPPQAPKKSKVTASDLAALFRASANARGILKKHILLDKVRFYASVTAGDAHKTAVWYSKVTRITYAVVALAGLLCTLEQPQLVIQPDFLGEHSRYDLSFRVRIRPLFFIAAFLSLLISYVNQIKPKRQKKGGHPYEPTASTQ